MGAKANNKVTDVKTGKPVKKSKFNPLQSTKRGRICQTVLDLAAILSTAAIFGVVYKLVDPKIRYFYCSESDIFHPYIKDTIPFWAVGIFGFCGPVLIMLLVELLNVRVEGERMMRTRTRTRLRTFLIHAYHGLSLFMMGGGVTMCLTEIGKRWIGRLRPHFIDVCKPNLSQLNCTSVGLTGTFHNPIYTGGSFCTGHEDEIKEARFSFPSGHSSFSWYTMLFTIIYLEARFVRLKGRYIKVLLQLACFIAAWVTTLSRVSDYHHRFTDVLAGTILGCLIAMYITLVTGRFIFRYNRVIEYLEIDLKPMKQDNDDKKTAIKKEISYKEKRSH